MGTPPENSAAIQGRFDELFKAARVLLREGVAEEERIVPTLALANAVRQSWSLAEEKKGIVDHWDDPENRKRLVEMFAYEHASLRPIDVRDNVLLLERLPVYVYVHDPVYVGNVINKWDTPPTAGTEAMMHWDRGVVVAVYRHSRFASPEEVASAYEKTLTSSGVSYEETFPEPLSGSMRLEYTDDYWLIIVEPSGKTATAVQKARGHQRQVFPHPQRVGEHYGLLMGKPSGGGFLEYLSTHKRGRTAEPYNLIPACVAFYLSLRVRGNREEVDRKEVHRLLNEHVLRESWKTLPEGGHSSSETNQLWRNAEKFGKRLLAASRPLHHSEPEWMLAHTTFSAR